MRTKPMRFALAALALTTGTALAGPAKPGLWETRTLSDGDTETDTQCVAAKDNAFSDWRKQINPGCKVTVLKETATAVAYDYLCASGTQTGKGHMSISYSSPTQYKASFSFDGKLVAGGKTIPLVTKMEQSGRWISADCGDEAEDDEG